MESQCKDDWFLSTGNDHPKEPRLAQRDSHLITFINLSTRNMYEQKGHAK